jgi:hypothetical protein
LHLEEHLRRRLHDDVRWAVVLFGLVRVELQHDLQRRELSIALRADNCGNSAPAIEARTTLRPQQARARFVLAANRIGAAHELPSRG